ncbi:MAG: cytidine deaminase [Tannerella sp.]|jgi:cytidine deaminase|nr:cytidine deaminase [Tannerella sp.]
MKEYKIEIPVLQKRIDELTGKEKKWRDAAIVAAKQAYAPYSNFQVGAVVILEDDTIVTGNNQENAAYPSGLCAERVALFSAGAHFPDKAIKTIVIVALKDGVIQDKISPCGACRQVLLESEMRYNCPIQILLCDKEEVRFIHSAKALLPLSFNADNL